jgi:hypothetical protein
VLQWVSLFCSQQRRQACSRLPSSNSITPKWHFACDLQRIAPRPGISRLVPDEDEPYSETVIAEPDAGDW